MKNAKWQTGRNGKERNFFFLSVYLSCFHVIFQFVFCFQSVLCFSYLPICLASYFFLFVLFISEHPSCFHLFFLFLVICLFVFFLFFSFSFLLFVIFFSFNSFHLSVSVIIHSFSFPYLPLALSLSSCPICCFFNHFCPFVPSLSFCLPFLLSVQFFHYLPLCLSLSITLYFLFVSFLIFRCYLFPIHPFHSSFRFYLFLFFSFYFP